MADERRHEFTRGLYGWITHTDFASTDAAATRDWCQAVLDWTFQPAMPTPGGDYHLFAYSDSGGGGIRQVEAGEQPGSTPTVHVANTAAAYEAALAAGAEGVRPPTKVMEGVCVAMVRAPGGVLIGFSGPTDPTP
jgi:predicted enzyme related to lactoylglutathione lyase